jgi:hypothetical protein
LKKHAFHCIADNHTETNKSKRIMKKIFIITLLISTACSLGAQKTKGIPQNLTGKDLSQHYLQKSSNQKAGAFILMAGGLAVGILGGLNTIDFMESDRDKSGAYTMIGIGAASFIASFPLFISASKYKLRAMMVIRTQQINVPSSTSLRQTGIGLLIPLDL